MTLARRLLGAAGGSGAFTPSAQLQQFALAAAPEGGWCWFADPRAIQYNGTTYYTYIDDEGLAKIVDYTAGVLGTPFTLHDSHPTGEATDDHNVPTFIIRNSDHKLVAFYCGHVAEPMYVRVSSNAEDVSAWAAETDISSSIGGTLYTYPNPVQLSDESNAIYLFFRDHVDGEPNAPDWCYSKSTDGGATWAAEVDFVETTYARISDNGTDRIDIIASEHPNDTDRNEHSIWHGYCTGGNFYQTDGTLIGAMNAGPYATSAMTKVYDGATTYGWVWDVALDPISGDPRCVYTTYPDNDGLTHKYNYARWTGSAWETHEIVDGGQRITTSGPDIFYSGGVVLDQSDPRVVFCAIGQGGDEWDIHRYRTDDGGTTWSSYALTSSGKNIRPVGVRGYGASLQVLWMKGTYTTYLDYSVGTSGAGV